MPPFASYPSLSGRTVFVSGGGSGIGASIVEHFAEQGARVGFVDIDEAASKALIEKIEARRHTVPLFVPCDIRDVAAYQASHRRRGREARDHHGAGEQRRTRRPPHARAR